MSSNVLMEQKMDVLNGLNTGKRPTSVDDSLPMDIEIYFLILPDELSGR